MRKQLLGGQQGQLEPQQEETARIPAPWDTQLLEEDEEVKEKGEERDLKVEPEEERGGRLSSNPGRQEREGRLSSNLDRQEGLEKEDREDEIARRGKPFV